jgi:hypothetical protein
LALTGNVEAVERGRERLESASATRTAQQVTLDPAAVEAEKFATGQ